MNLLHFLSGGLMSVFFPVAYLAWSSGSLSPSPSPTPPSVPTATIATWLVDYSSKDLICGHNRLTSLIFAASAELRKHSPISGLHQPLCTAVKCGFECPVITLVRGHVQNFHSHSMCTLSFRHPPPFSNSRYSSAYFYTINSSSFWWL